MPIRALRVLHVAQPTDGGVARWITDAVADQISRGWDVHVACPASGSLRNSLDTIGVHYHRWEAVRGPRPVTIRETRDLGRIVAAVEPELVHLHSSKAGLAGRLALRGRCPTVFQPHAWSFEAMTGVARAGAVAWERWAARWAHAIVCVSHAEKARGEAVGIRARWAVTPNGVDVSRWTIATDEERVQARAELGVPDVPTAVCVGRLSAQKGQDVLLAAWSRVLAEVREARLYLVGDGPARPQLASQKVPGVTLVGHSDDVAGWLAAADVVAIPSRWEGMSLAMLEAMARGRSVVATDVPGAREVIGAGSGAVVIVGDTEALARELTLRLLDLEKSAAEGSSARRVIEASHDLRRTLDAIAEVSFAVATGTAWLPEHVVGPRAEQSE